MFYKNISLKFLKDRLYLINLKLFTDDFKPSCLVGFWSLFYGLFMSIKVFRVLFNLPVNGQNGWTTLNSLRKYNNYVYSYKWFFFKGHFAKAKKKYFLAEYFNLFFQACFCNQWRLNKKGLRTRRFKRRFLDVSSLCKLNYINLFRSKFARAISKKKNKIGFTRNLGLRFGFSKKFHANLIN